MEPTEDVRPRAPLRTDAKPHSSGSIQAVDPTPERFRRLARSAPYRWSALVLEGTWGPRGQPSRTFVIRPDWARVERLDGTPVHEGRQGSLGAGPLLPGPEGWHAPAIPALVPPPELDADGLVAAARRPWQDGPEVPFWQDYRCVAVLDPYELSEGVDVLEVAAVDHRGRPAWQALLRPGPDYEPRCACCPLLRSRASDLMEGLEPLSAYADAHRVRLDTATGVCVRAREDGGPSDGQGHDLAIVQAVP
jgi:hypothetical protein